MRLQEDKLIWGSCKLNRLKGRTASPKAANGHLTTIEAAENPLTTVAQLKNQVQNFHMD